MEKELKQSPNQEDNKIYVFLSHSRRDYEKVRVVRDLLEDEGFRPLMFFLKCLEKKEYEELTKILITEEIDNRQRFFLCNSENAKESDWVKFEVKHIKESKRPYEIVDLDWPIEKIKEAMKRFRIRSTVFLSYPHTLRGTQKEIVRELNQKLKNLDFNTFYDEVDLMGGCDFEKEIKINLARAAESGYFITFIGRNFTEGSWQHKEAKIALEYGAAIIPVVISPMTDFAISFFMKWHWIDIQDMPASEASAHIVDCLLRLDLKKNK